MSEQEQNKKINELDRRLTRLERNINALNIDLEPDGRVSEAFDHLENSMDEQFKEVRKNQDRIRYDLSQLKGSIEAILQRLTSVDDLPEE